MCTINFPAIAPSAAHNFSVKTIEFKMAAVSVKRSNLITCSKKYHNLKATQVLQLRAFVETRQDSYFRNHAKVILCRVLEISSMSISAML